MTTGSTIARFTITLSKSVAEPVQVAWNTKDGTAKAGIDYAATSGTAVFSPGETNKDVDVLVYGRAVGTEDRNFFLEMTPPPNAILGESIGECIIYLDTAGNTAVIQVIVPTGPQGAKGDSAYQSWLNLGNTGTEQDFIDSLSPSAEEIAEEVAPLLNVGNSPVTAEGTETLSKPDAMVVKALARRVAYVGAAKIATVVLATGDNLIGQSDLTGDTLDMSSVGIYPRIMRCSSVLSPEWSVEPDGRLLIKGAVAGDVLYVCQYDIVSAQSVLNTCAPIAHQSLEALRRSYAEAGYLVKGAFVAGEKVDSATDVLIDEATGNGHSHSGPYPHTVVVGETPASASWSDKSGDVLRSQLASPVGTNLIGLPAGGVLTDAIKSVAYLDAYEHLVVSGDWSAALQAALDTGLPLVPNPTVTYNVNGIIQSKGNRIIGPLNINPTRTGLSDLGAFTFNGEQGGGFQKNLKLLYVFKVYDLIEFMYIRSMGFNAILHVGALYVDRPELDNDTLKDAIKLALDNAQTAGLSVNMHTGWEIATDGMAIDYVNTFSPHPAVFGFSVFDEPTWNGVSVARQSERLTALRAITEKNLNCVDSIANYSSYRNGYNPWTHGYDIMFVDAYSHTTPGATLLENINNDLRNMRRDVGVAAVYCPGSKIIPVCGLFKSTSFSADFQQIKATSSKLVRAAGGDFGVWAWDPLDPVVTVGVRTDTDLRALSKTFCEIVMNGDRIPKAYRIGGTGQNPDSIPPCAARDGVFVVQKQDGAPTFVQSGTTCLGVLRPGTDAEFAFNGLSFPIGGLLFKGTYPVAITNIPMQQYMTIDFELVDVTGSQSGTMYFHYTQDEGATTSPEALSFGFVFTPSVPALSKSLYFGTGEYWRGNKLVVALAVNEPAQEAFRICMHGFIVTSDW